jgi:hypothetical protein
VRPPWALPAAVRALPGALRRARALLRRLNGWLEDGDPEPDQDEGVGW